ncbi:MAG: MFS transporter [Rhodospirillaceae bacterium]|nr:MAG: MFS transporter [Rhodospirillaceae bacterium]
MNKPSFVKLSAAETHKVVLGAMIALFLAALDQTIIATALPSIGSDLGDFHLMAWIVTAYLLTSTAATPILGKLSDLHGRRPVMRASILIFLLGSVLCALSPSMPFLILARALQGFGGGGLITLAQTVVADVVSPRERGRYGAYFAGVWAGSSLLGPVLGGFLTEYASWHWIFWINLPIGLAAILITDRILHRLTGRGGARRIDYVSVLCFTVSSTTFLLALSWGGTEFPWASWQVIVAIACSIVTGSIFASRQRRLDEPIMPPRFFSDTVVTPVLIAVFLVFGAYLALAVLVPTFLQLSLQQSPRDVGLLMIPLLLSSTIGAAISGQYIHRTGGYKLPTLLGLPLAIACLVLLGILTPQATPMMTAGLLLLAGLGIGPIFPIANVAAQNAVERRDLGAVSGAISFARALGGAAATAGGSALVLGLMVAMMPARAADGGLTEILSHPLDATARLDLAHAYTVFVFIAAGILAVGLFAFSRIEQRPLQDSRSVDTSVEIG